MHAIASLVAGCASFNFSSSEKVNSLAPGQKCAWCETGDKPWSKQWWSGSHTYRSRICIISLQWIDALTLGHSIMHQWCINPCSYNNVLVIWMVGELVETRGYLNTKMQFYQERDSCYKDKTVWWPSYLYNGNTIPGKRAFILEYALVMLRYRRSRILSQSLLSGKYLVQTTQQMAPNLKT